MSTLHDSPASILAELLLLGNYFGDPNASTLIWPLYVNFLPDSDEVPDDVGAIYDTASVRQPRLMDGTNLFYYGVQVRVRAQNQVDAWAQIKPVCDLFESIAAWQTSMDSAHTYTLQDIAQQGAPLWLGIEPGTKRRCGYTVNFLATIAEGGTYVPPIFPSSPGAIVRVVIITTNYNLKNSDSGAEFVTTGATAPVTVQLPPWSSGLNYSVEHDDAFQFTLQASGSDKIRLGSVISSAGGNVTNAAGDYGTLSLLASSPGVWRVDPGATGVWSAN